MAPSGRFMAKMRSPKIAGGAAISCRYIVVCIKIPKPDLSAADEPEARLVIAGLCRTCKLTQNLSLIRLYKYEGYLRKCVVRRQGNHFYSGPT